MTTQTLLEAGKLINDEIMSGVVDTIVDTNPIFTVMPFSSFSGQAFVVNEEATEADSAEYNVGDTITSDTAETYNPVTFLPTSLIGHSDLNTLVAGTSSSAGVDMKARGVFSKAKSISRKIQDRIVNGSGVAPAMGSMFSQVAASQSIGPVDLVAGDALSYDKLDELLDLVKAKDGQVDFILMSEHMLRKYRSLVRTLGGNDIPQITLADDRIVNAYNGIPIFKSGYKKPFELLDGTAITGGNWDSVYAGTFDDGDLKSGCTLVYPEAFSSGMEVIDIGPQETVDGTRVRVAWYGNFAVTNKLGLARAYGIDPTL